MRCRKALQPGLTTDEAKAGAEKKLGVAVERLENRPQEPPVDDVLIDPDAPEPSLTLD